MAGRDYGKVAPLFWTSNTGRRLRPFRDAQTLALYLLTCQSSSMYGIYHIAVPTMAFETGMSADEVTAALAKLAEENFAHYDMEAGFVWVVNMAHFQIADVLQESDKRIPAIRREAVTYKSHPFAARFWDYYEAPFHLGKRPFEPPAAKALPEQQKALISENKPEGDQEGRGGDQEGSSPRARAIPGDGSTGHVAQPGADSWIRHFAVRYWERFGKQYGRGMGDASACGRFEDHLRGLPSQERSEDWEDRDRIIAAFFARDDRRTVNGGWKFSFFVEDFNGLRLQVHRLKAPSIATFNPADQPR